MGVRTQKKALSRLRHEHKFEAYGYTGKPRVMIEKCACGEERRRRRTAAEREQHRLEDADNAELHRLPRAFSAALGEATGYEATEIAEKWADKHPERIFLASIDDSHFSSSSIVFITSETPKTFFCTGAYVISQCSGDKPLLFNMYPGHSSSLMEALKQVKKRERMKRTGRKR